MAPTTSITSTASPSSPAIPSPTSSDPGRGTDVSPVPASASQVWIAGAVAGPVFGCVLVGVLIWWIMKRRMKKAVTATAAGATVAPNNPYGHHHHNQPLPLWPHPPSHGTTPSNAWDVQSKLTPPLSTGTSRPPQELSSHDDVVHELHHGQ